MSVESKLIQLGKHHKALRPHIRPVLAALTKKVARGYYDVKPPSGAPGPPLEQIEIGNGNITFHGRGHWVQLSNRSFDKMMRKIDRGGIFEVNGIIIENRRGIVLIEDSRRRAMYGRIEDLRQHWR